MAGRSWPAIWSWFWPSRVRRPASVMMIWNTLASAIPRSLAISGAIASVSVMAAARALAWRSDISRESRWMVGLMAARKPSSPRHCRWECGGSPHGVEHELADGGGWGGSGCSHADPPGQSILDQLVAVSDQLFLGLEVVADGLFGDLGLARHVADGDLLILVERRLAVMGLSDRAVGPRGGCGAAIRRVAPGLPGRAARCGGHR